MENEELDYELKMKCYNDGLTYRFNMDKNILIMNLLIILGSLYMLQTYDLFIIPFISNTLSYISNIISDKLGAYYEENLSQCIYIDEYKKIANEKNRYCTIVNTIYYITFYVGVISAIILFII